MAEGEARDHGYLHYLFGGIHLALFVTIALLWRPPDKSPVRPLRGALLIVLGVAAAAAFLESIGASGYDRSNLGARIGWLTTLHNVTAPVGAVGVLAIPISLVALVAALAGRIHGRHEEAIREP